MNVIDTEIPEVKIIEPKIFKDDRGYFYESFNQKEFDEKVEKTVFVQDNQSCSKKGTVRGLHWQIGPFVQAKLVRVVKGAVYDVAVDIRQGSPTFMKHVGVLLTADNHKQFYIPRGFAHGFIALEDDTVFQYKCDNVYCKNAEAALKWDSIAGLWPEDIMKDMEVILSEKDFSNPTPETIDEGHLLYYTEF